MIKWNAAMVAVICLIAVGSLLLGLRALSRYRATSDRRYLVHAILRLGMAIAAAALASIGFTKL